MKKIRVEQYLNQSLPNLCKPTCRVTSSLGLKAFTFNLVCARGKHYDAETQEQTHLFTPVMLNLFQHLTSLACNLFTDKILKLSWIIRDLAGVTSRSTLRARLHRCPTENPQVQDDTIRNFCNELFNHSTVYITPSQPSPSREGAEVIQCKTWRAAPC